MTYLLHLASILPLLMRFIGPLLNSNGFWWHNFHNFKVALDLLMGPSSKSISLGIIRPIVIGLMGRKRSTTWTIQLWWTTVGCSFIWTSGTQVHTMTSISFTSWTFTSHGINILSTHMSILNTYWVTLITWVSACLWCITLRGVSWCLEFMWMLLIIQQDAI